MHNREKQQENLEGYVKCNQLAADKLTTLIMTQIKDEKDETPQLTKMNQSTNTRLYMKKFHYSTSSQFKIWSNHLQYIRTKSCKSTAPCKKINIHD